MQILFYYFSVQENEEKDACKNLQKCLARTEYVLQNASNIGGVCLMATQRKFNVPIRVSTIAQMLQLPVAYLIEKSGNVKMEWPSICASWLYGMRVNLDLSLY